MLSPIEKRLRTIAWLALVLLLATLGWQCRHGWPVTADLMTLTPQISTDPLRSIAQQRVDAPLTKQVLVLVGHQDPLKAVTLAESVKKSLTDHQSFDDLRLHIDIDLATLRQSLLALRLAALPSTDRELIIKDPSNYAAKRAQEIIDPFASVGTVALSDDLLGLASHTERGVQPNGTVHLALDSSTLQAAIDGRTWVLLLGKIGNTAFDNTSTSNVALALDKAKTLAHQRGGELLAAGGPLYAAAGSQQAATESSRIGTASLVGTILLLLITLRRASVLLAFFPVAVGLIAGVVACVALFGKVHVLTLVIGMSLLGIAIDFPMHWLGKSYGIPDWRPQGAMRLVLPGLTISLLVTIIGYIALAFTPFPALTQTAIFSVAGLVASYLTTVLLLPSLLSRLRPRPWPALAFAAQWVLTCITRTRELPSPVKAIVLLLAISACIAGMLRIDVRDDLRQWLHVPPSLIEQAQEIGSITGVMPTSQFFLIRAPDTDTLLVRHTALATRLDTLVSAGQLKSYTALNQIIAPLSAQQALKNTLSDHTKHTAVWQPLLDLGIAEGVIQQELETLNQLPLLTIDDVLKSPLTEQWHGLWLGSFNNEVAAMVTLQGLRSTEGLSDVTQGLPGISLVDRPSELNAAFSSTRIEAAQLKVASYLVGAILIWLALGRAAMWRILIVPVVTTITTLAALGFAGQPITLFSLFGLLLVSAIAVDYAIFMYEGVGGTPACLVGILLGALTTLLAFGMLAASATPVIASFGLTVTIGVTFSVFFAAWIRPPSTTSLS